MDKNKTGGADGTDTEKMTDEELNLKAEMEELARTFQEELDKAKAEEEILAKEREKEQEILIQELEDDIRFDEEDAEDIPEDELCKCCGEKRRGTKDNPDSPYCRDCERGLRRYPFDFLNIILVLAVVGFSIFACVNFTGRAKLYSSSITADKYADQNKLYSANNSYKDTLQLLSDESINAELVYQRAVANMFKIGQVDIIPTYEEHFKSFEMKLPHFKKATTVFKQNESIRVTALMCEEILDKYSDMLGEDDDLSVLPYEEIIAKLDALLSSSPDEAYSVLSSNGEGAVSVPIYAVRATQYDKAVINLYKYLVASSLGKGEETYLPLLEECRSLHPELIWIYGDSLSSLYLQSGKDVTELYNYWKSINEEDCQAKVIMITQMRLRGNYTQAIAFADSFKDIMLQYSVDSVDFIPELFRQQALCYLMTDNYEKAFEIADSVYQLCKMYQFGLYNSEKACYTLALCSVAVGDNDTYKSVESFLSNYEIEMHEDVLKYKDGSLDIKTILTQGDCDIG